MAMIFGLATPVFLLQNAHLVSGDPSQMNSSIIKWTVQNWTSVKLKYSVGATLDLTDKDE